MFEQLEVPLLNYSYNHINNCVTGQFKGIEFSLQQPNLLIINNFYNFDLSKKITEKDILNAFSHNPCQTPYLEKQIYTYKYQNIFQPFIENINVFKILYTKFFSI